VGTQPTQPMESMAPLVVEPPENWCTPVQGHLATVVSVLLQKPRPTDAPLATIELRTRRVMGPRRSQQFVRLGTCRCSGHRCPVVDLGACDVRDETTLLMFHHLHLEVSPSAPMVSVRISRTGVALHHWCAESPAEPNGVRGISRTGVKPDHD
jgi:hypothetical protein